MCLCCGDGSAAGGSGSILRGSNPSKQRLETFLNVLRSPLLTLEGKRFCRVGFFMIDAAATALGEPL